MIAKSSLLVLLAAPFVAPLTINAPSNVQVGKEFQITWSKTDSDPSVFSIELRKPVEFNEALAVANNVDINAGSITIPALQEVPATDGYTIQFVNITDITKVYAESPSFSVAAAASTTASSPSSTGSGGGGASGSGSPSGSGSSPSATSPSGSASSGRPTSSGTGSSSAPSGSGSAAPNNNGALSLSLPFGLGSGVNTGMVLALVGAGVGLAL